MKNISINCHSSICINSNVYIDPFNIKDEIHNAEVVFVTHDHFDHYDYESIINIINDYINMMIKNSLRHFQG